MQRQLLRHYYKLTFGCALSGLIIAKLSIAAAATLPPSTDILPSGVPLPSTNVTTSAKPKSAGSFIGGVVRLRDWLDKHGLSLSVQEIDELWGVAAGGSSGGASYNGATAMTFSADLEKAIGIRDGLFNVSALQIHGRSISNDKLGSFASVSGFDTMPGSRLFELWYQQGFFKNTLDFRIGKLDLDTEFLVSQNASLFLNASFGWPLAPANNLYNGGPSWPYSSPAVRVRYAPIKSLLFQAAIADDNPTDRPFDASSNPAAQRLHPSGTNFNFRNGAFAIAELQLSPNIFTNLPGTYKIGGFYDTANYPDYRYDNQGALLASVQSDGHAARHRGNSMLYLVIDQRLWNSDDLQPKAVNGFVRTTYNNGTENLVNFGADAGLTFQGFIPKRNNDSFGVGWGIGVTSARARAYDRDVRRLDNPAYVVAGTENHLEFTYQTQIKSWLMLQPDFQYVWDPSGGVLNTKTNRPIRNTAVFGLHSSITF